MKSYLIALLLLFSSFSYANQLDSQCPQFSPWGAPQVNTGNVQDQYSCKKNYAILHSCNTKTARFVIEKLNARSIQGPSKRKNDFRPDPAISPTCQAQLSDYAGTPYDRGHMSPGADNTINDEIMSESFFLSNMVPQVPNNNRGIWKQLEEYTRSWALKEGDLFVTSGPIYDKGFTTIGSNKVGVPTRLYKIIINAKTGKNVAFIFPNQPLPVADLPKYIVSIRDVEMATNINFNPAVKDNRWGTVKGTISK